jgi:autotransporter-associated beta strand protein
MFVEATHAAKFSGVAFVLLVMTTASASPGATIYHDGTDSESMFTFNGIAVAAGNEYVVDPARVSLSSLTYQTASGTFAGDFLTILRNAQLLGVHAGDLQVNLRLDGGTLSCGGWPGEPTTPQTYSDTLALLSNSTINTNGHNVGIASTISGTGALTKAGAGTLTLSGTNSYQGATTIEAGTLKAGSVGALGNTSGVNVLSGAAFDFGGSKLGQAFTIEGDGPDHKGALINTGTSFADTAVGLTLSGDATIGGSGRFDIGLGGRQLNGGGHTLTKIGTSSVDIRGTVTNLKALNVNEGILYFEVSNAALPTTTITVTSGAVLGAYGNFTTNAPVVLNGGTLGQLGKDNTATGTWSGAVTVNSTSVLSTKPTSYAGGNLTLSGPISGAGGLTIAGPYTVTLSGANSYNGATNVTSGILKMGAATGLGNTSEVTVNAGATFDFGGFKLGKSFTIAGSGTAGQGALINTGTSAYDDAFNLTLTADATIGGTGRFDIATSGRQLNGGGFTLTKKGTNQIAIRGTVTNLKGLNVEQGTVYFENANQNLPTTSITVSSGAILGAWGTVAINAPVVLNGGTLAQIGYNDSATSTWSGPITLNAASTVSTKPGSTGGNLKLTGPISGDGGLTITGQYRLTLEGSNSYNGGTTLKGSTLLVNNASGSGTGSGLVTVDGGVLGGTGTIGGSVHVNTGAIAPGASVGTLTIDGDLTLSSGASLNFELGSPGIAHVGGTSNDLLTGINDLTLDGVLNLAAATGFGAPEPGQQWRLIEYNGMLTDNGLELGSLPALEPGLFYYVDTSTPGQVNLSIGAPEPSSLALAAVALLGIAVAMHGGVVRRPR